MEEWRRRVLERLDLVLPLFFLVLSMIFLSWSYLDGSLYLRGVGVGLVIAGITGAIAYLVKRQMGDA
jgi:hypothetical protein